MSAAFRIKDVRTYTVKPSDKAGTYFKPGESKHWLVAVSYTHLTLPTTERV